MAQNIYLKQRHNGEGYGNVIADENDSGKMINGVKRKTYPNKNKLREQNKIEGVVEHKMRNGSENDDGQLNQQITYATVAGTKKYSLENTEFRNVIFKDRRSDEYIKRGIWWYREKGLTMQDYLDFFIQKYGKGTITMIYQVAYKKIEAFARDENMALKITEGDVVIRNTNTKVNMMNKAPIKLCIKNVMPWLTKEEIIRALSSYGEVIKETIEYIPIETEIGNGLVRSGSIVLYINRNWNINIPSFFTPKIAEDYHRWYVAPMTVKCHNCGQYGHWVKYCEKDHNQEEIQRRIDEERERKNKNGVELLQKRDDVKVGEMEGGIGSEDIQKVHAHIQGNLESVNMEQKVLCKRDDVKVGEMEGGIGSEDIQKVHAHIQGNLESVNMEQKVLCNDEMELNENRDTDCLAGVVQISENENGFVEDSKVLGMKWSVVDGVEQEDGDTLIGMDEKTEDMIQQIEGIMQNDLDLRKSQIDKELNIDNMMDKQQMEENRSQNEQIVKKRQKKRRKLKNSGNSECETDNEGCIEEEQMFLSDEDMDDKKEIRTVKQIINQINDINESFRSRKQGIINERERNEHDNNDKQILQEIKGILKQAIINRRQKRKIYTENNTSRFSLECIEMIERENNDFFRLNKLEEEIKSFIAAIKKTQKNKDSDTVLDGTGSASTPGCKVGKHRLEGEQVFVKKIEENKELNRKKNIPMCNLQLTQLIKTVDQAVEKRNGEEEFLVEFFDYFESIKMIQLIDDVEVLKFLHQHMRLESVYEFIEQALKHQGEMEMSVEVKRKIEEILQAKLY